MRRPLIVGNWKMNQTPAQTLALLESLCGLEIRTRVDVVVCPMTVSLFAAATQLQGSAIHLGAQNVHFEEAGAFTGEVNAASLLELGVEYVILGHSERRRCFGETDESVNRKVLRCLADGLRPIVCVGETQSEHERGLTRERICMQAKAALCGVSSTRLEELVLAYEPVWAIGTGCTATAQEANDAIASLRAVLRELYGDAAAAVRILYGGSMNETNAAELMRQPEIDGGLIGSASLVPEKFARIINYSG